MCDNVELLKIVADDMIRKEHAELDNEMTKQDQIDFVNIVYTLFEHSQYIQKNIKIKNALSTYKQRFATV